MSDDALNENDQVGYSQTKTASGYGDFFAVDRRSWAKACQHGMNAAVTYLVLARGTGRDNRRTAWSIQAVEKYTGISRGRAQQALERLRTEGLVDVLRDGTKPQYRLRPACDVPGSEAYLPPELDELERKMFDRLCAGMTQVPVKGGPEWGCSNPNKIAKQLVTKGWAQASGYYNFKPINHDIEAAREPDWIWLPNELVTGAADEVPPVELIRQTQDVMTLRLLIDLYHAHNLRDDSGISRAIIYKSYERVEAGRQAQFKVWGFHHQSGWVTWVGPSLCHRRDELTEDERARGVNIGVDYFRREAQLVDLGLLEFVPTLIESDDPEAEFIHPYGIGTSDSLDDQLGAAAHNAALEMLTAGQLDWVLERDFHLAPVPRHIANVQMVGIARLRYRPRTRKTAAWWADLQAKGEHFLLRYEQLTQDRSLDRATGA